MHGPPPASLRSPPPPFKGKESSPAFPFPRMRSEVNAIAPQTRRHTSARSGMRSRLRCLGLRPGFRFDAEVMVVLRTPDVCCRNALFVLACAESCIKLRSPGLPHSPLHVLVLPSPWKGEGWAGVGAKNECTDPHRHRFARHLPLSGGGKLIRIPVPRTDQIGHGFALSRPVARALSPQTRPSRDGAGYFAALVRDAG